MKSASSQTSCLRLITKAAEFHLYTHWVPSPLAHNPCIDELGPSDHSQDQVDYIFRLWFSKCQFQKCSRASKIYTWCENRTQRQTCGFGGVLDYQHQSACLVPSCSSEHPNTGSFDEAHPATASRRWRQKDKQRSEDKLSSGMYRSLDKPCRSQPPVLRIWGVADLVN